MRDFKVIRAQALLKVSAVSPIRGLRPASVMVLGEHLDLTGEVLYNGVSAPEYVIAAANRLIVRIPTSQIGRELTEIKILSDVHLSRQDAVISLEIGKPPKTVSGIDRLVQSFVLVFLSTPGSDIFNPSSGGGAKALVGRTNNNRGAAADLALAVERTKTQLLRAQASNARIPAEERLLSANLSTAQFDAATTALTAVVELRNAIGDGALVSIR